MRRCWLVSLAVLFASTAAADPLTTGSETELPGVGDTGSPAGIVNGTVTTAYPGVVALLAYDDGYGGVFCSGTQISSRWILTAAHCVEAFTSDYAGYELWAMFTANVYEDAWKGIKIKRGIMHPQYDPDAIANDLGLIELVSARTPSQAVVLNDEGLNSAWEGKRLTFVGYGVTTDGGQDEGVRRKTQIPIVGCFNQYDPGYIYDCSDSKATVIYSEASNTNVCQGDSGGAALEVLSDGSYELAGVNSFVTPQCVNGGNGSARVDKYVSWIRGYVPDAMTEADTDTDSDTDADTDSDSDIDTEVDTGWADPERPDEGAYERPVFGFCGSVPAAPSALWAAGLAAIALGRRRRG